ncbi:MAG: hypothetical protein ABR583_07080 [Gaiellaceae bacterium]
MTHPRLFAFVLAVAVASALPTPAMAGELVARNATRVQLSVSADGKALVSYRSAGRAHAVLAWGAINAIAPTLSRPQVALRLDYSGGWRSLQTRPSRFRNRCAAYDGPRLHWLIAACKAPDGSYWALQNWQRALPNYGLAASPQRRVYELWLSHWRGPLPTFEVSLGWTQARFHTIFGRLTYLGKPVHGFGTGIRGRPTDSYGRVLYVDTLDSRYGTGWRRENSFVTHKGTGVFCYGFFPHGRYPTGMGKRYRITAMGPGVLPDLYWEGVPQATYDASYDQAAKAKLRAFGDSSCG